MNQDYMFRQIVLIDLDVRSKIDKESFGSDVVWNAVLGMKRRACAGVTILYPLKNTTIKQTFRCLIISFLNERWIYSSGDGGF